MNKVATALLEARNKIIDPTKWTQGYGARDANGKAVDPTSPRAVCWCSIGAYNTIHTDDDTYREGYRILSSAMDLDITGFNDANPHQEVIERFNRAITVASNMQLMKETTPINL